MAIDEAIAREQLVAGELPTLRFYGWNPASFSLGYFQDASKVLDIPRCAKEKTHFVRRFTGGEVIFHDQELTYSLSFPRPAASSFNSVKDSFKINSSFILETYRKLGLDAGFTSQGSAGGSGALCFESCEEYDIMVRGKKLGGSSQRRIKNIIFQHGSIPFKIDFNKFKPFLNHDIVVLEDKVISLEEALGRQISFKDLGTLLKESFKEVFGVELIERDLNFKELESADRLRKEKYQNPRWNVLRKYPKETVLVK
ncbi:MAG: lipoate--protein ligase family protein [Candidatus Omnitrophica bacterium]|nr:lipoate--protein ligase family protein [Candidatus Omnitrophota bacterium]